VQPIQATPFVPGLAHGRLCLGAAAATPESIVLITQAELGRLSTRPAGVILVDAALYAHPTLRLLSRGIPTVLLDSVAAKALAPGAEVRLEGHAGRLLPPGHPACPEDHPPPPPTAGAPIRSRDGVAIELRCSVTDARGAAAARAAGAAAIGLARSEYLYPEDGRQPDTAFLTQACAGVCAAADPLPVTFRLIDIAGDKRPPWLPDLPGLGGTLGLQGARLYGLEPVRSVYLAQLEALAALAGRCRLRILLPYLVALEELERLHAEIRGRLSGAVPIGSMLETPAAALAVHEFLTLADFAALGMNDLMQCLFAADRYRPELSGYLDPYSPIIYRFLREVAALAGTDLARVQVNGLLAQLPGVLPALIGLGYRAFSVDPVMLPWLAQCVRQTDTGSAAALAEAVCAARRSSEAKALLSSPQMFA
jgi:phosphoenolpyruvate-protein kinase (PTS system EI component)